MRKQPKFVTPRKYQYFPSQLAVVVIDNEQVLLGPIIAALMKERSISANHIVRKTSCDFRTLRDFLQGKQTKRAVMGIGVTSQILRAADITIPDIVTKARDMRLSGQLPCIKPPDVASSANDGRTDERTTADDL